MAKDDALFGLPKGWATVTGAAGGIGREIAIGIARRSKACPGVSRRHDACVP